MVNIRLSTYKDLNIIMDIYDKARLFMRSTNNMNQWTNGYPSIDVIKEDIDLKRHYVVEVDNEIVAAFTFINGDDETYHFIEGKWLNDEPYGVIHRIGSNQKYKGILKLCVDYCFQFVNNVRIDTHKDNMVMQHLLKKQGFIPCGIIYLKDGNPRLAFQKSDILTNLEKQGLLAWLR